MRAVFVGCIRTAGVMRGSKQSKQPLVELAWLQSGDIGSLSVGSNPSNPNTGAVPAPAVQLAS